MQYCVNNIWGTSSQRHGNGRGGGGGGILAWNLTLQQNKRKQRGLTQAKPIWEKKVVEPSVKMSDNSWLWLRDDNNTPKSFTSASSATHVETFSTWTITHIVPVPLLSQHPPSSPPSLHLQLCRDILNSLDLAAAADQNKSLLLDYLFSDISGTIYIPHPLSEARLKQRWRHLVSSRSLV